jgi:hypothetical protein
VEKAPLIAKLKENREKHRAVFEEALEGYREKAVQALQKNIDNIKAGRPHRVYISLQLPEDYTREYDAAIGLLELSVDDTVELDEKGYKNFYLDRWDWTQSWATNSKGYTSATTNRMLDEYED